MNQDLKRLYLSIRKKFPLRPAHMALSSAREFYDIVYKLLAEIKSRDE